MTPYEQQHTSLCNQYNISLDFYFPPAVGRFKYIYASDPCINLV